MRDTAEYRRCATRGCPFLLRAPLTHCREHASELVTPERLETYGLMVD